MAAPRPARPTWASDFPFLPAHASPTPQEVLSQQISLHQTAFWRGRIRCSCGAIVARDCPGRLWEVPEGQEEMAPSSLGLGSRKRIPAGAQSPKAASLRLGGRTPSETWQRWQRRGARPSNAPGRLAPREIRLGLIGRRPRLTGRLHRPCHNRKSCRSSRLAAALTLKRDWSTRSSGFMPQNL